MKRIIIIGGGYAGFNLARALDATMDVVLIEPREAFVHCVGAIRALVDPSWLDQICLPYTNLLKRGQVIQERVIAIEDRAAQLSNGERVEGDYIVVATGSHYAAPFKPAGDNVTDFRKSSINAHEKLKAARSVAIIGAGAVGIELAGEIKALMPEKRITLISNHANLMPDQIPGLGQKLERALRAFAVDLRLGGGVKDLANITAHYTAPITLQSGETIHADLVFPVIGARVNNPLLPQTHTNGRAQVDPWLRVPGQATTFVIGDLAASGENMTVVGTMRQVPWLTKLLGALADGRQIETLPPYSRWPTPPLLIPIGPRNGASILPIGRNGMVVGGWLTSLIKGKKLFMPRYRKEFGL